MATEQLRFEAKVYQRPSDSVFTDAQWNTLFHLFNALVPKLTPEETIELKKDYYSYTTTPVDDALLDAFAQESAAECTEFVEDVNKTFNKHLPADKIKELALVLNVLNTRPGSFLMTGYTTPLHLLPRKDVEIILTGWANARLIALRRLYKSLAFVTKYIYARGSTTAHKAMGFPGYPFTDEAAEDLQQTLEAAAGEPLFQFEDLEIIDGKITLSQEQPTAKELPMELSTDILVLGSGSGGGVVASHLSKALPSHKVMVVEKGFWYPKHLQPTVERDMIDKMFEERASVQTDDGGLGILAGQTWGGGSAINWSVSWQLQGAQRREWAEKYGLKFATTREFQNCLDFVSQSMSVQTYEPQHHNPSNGVILTGSHLLGYRAIAVPQNIYGDIDKHSKICGAFCSGGCRGSGDQSQPGGGGKQGSGRTFLLNARDHGAKFIQGFQVLKLIFGKDGTVVGVRGLWRKSDAEDEGTGKEVVIMAKKVVCSAGTLHSPGILLRSGLKNWFIGRNLHLHPATVVNARWKEETRPWEGGILTSVGTECDNLDGKGHGARAEGMLMLPGVGLIHSQWKSALQFRQFLLRFRYLTGTVIVGRDRDSGRVFLDPTTSKNKVDYVPSEFDRKNIHECVIATCKTLHAAGAMEIFTPITNGPTYQRPDNPAEDEQVFDKFIQDLKAIGLPMVESSFGSAHQMGTCAMGTSPKNSAVDSCGRVWGVKNLYVADASLFPSASGVNPMLTTMALAEWVSRNIVQDVKKEEEAEQRARL